MDHYEHIIENIPVIACLLIWWHSQRQFCIY